MIEPGKMVILIGDGMGDWPVPELDGNTPLEAANKPNLDRLSREGENGLMDPIGPGVRAGSDTALGKVTYPSLMGMDYAKAELQKHIDAAIASLTIFDKRALPLRLIARYIMERKS